MARSDRSVAELAALQAVDALPLWRATDGKWQILQAGMSEDPDGSITAETGAPALVVHVVDSDFAVVLADSPGNLTWQCTLSPKTARAYDLPERWIGEPDDVTPRAVAWAEEAGLQPDPAAVRTALVAECDPFAEDLVFDLAMALGFRFAAGENLME